MWPTRRPKAKMGVRQPSHIRSASHLAWVRKFSCSILGRHECSGKVVAHHVHEEADGGIGIKPSDSFAIPLCDGAHRQLHDIGETAFMVRFGVDLIALAANLWRTSPHRPRETAP